MLLTILLVIITYLYILEQHFITCRITFKNILDGIQRRSTRSVASGNDMSSFVKDCISKFPKEKLVALFEEKKAEDESFKVAMESFELEEWNQIYSALWENEIFKQEVDILLGYGIDVAVLLDEAVAIMGIFK